MFFDFKQITESDLDLLYAWLNRPHVAEWWDGRLSFAEVRRRYVPAPDGSSSLRPYIACLNRTPVGFIQSYVAIVEQASGWWTQETDPGVVGIDQFLADAENLGKGIGTVMVVQFAELLFQDPRVTKIQTDPAPANLRAIRCYEKAGFRKVGIVDTPDGAALLMVIERRNGLKRMQV
ncbi:MAG: GNAT family N-acetyltransferase [Candidatus Binatia bacterium]